MIMKSILIEGNRASQALCFYTIDGFGCLATEGGSLTSPTMAGILDIFTHRTSQTDIVYTNIFRRKQQIIIE